MERGKSQWVKPPSITLWLLINFAVRGKSTKKAQVEWPGLSIIREKVAPLITALAGIFGK
jgi:hypothetical protein